MVGGALSVCSIYIILSSCAQAQGLRPKGAIGRYSALITAKRRPISPPRSILPEIHLKFTSEFKPAFAENDRLIGRGENWIGGALD